MCFLGVYTSLSFCTHALPFFLPDAQFTLRVPALQPLSTGRRPYAYRLRLYGTAYGEGVPRVFAHTRHTVRSMYAVPVQACTAQGRGAGAGEGCKITNVESNQAEGETERVCENGEETITRARDSHVPEVARKR